MLPFPIPTKFTYLGIPAGTAYAESDFCNYINTKINCLLGCATDTERLREQIHQSLLGYSTVMTTQAITETLHIIDTDIKYYMAQRFPQVQQPMESNSEEYENESNNPVTAQAKFTVNKKPRVLFPTTLSYYQTSQSRIVFNPPLETQSETPRTPGNPHSWNQHSWTKLLRKYGLLFGNLTPAAGQTEGNLSTWKQPPAQNLAESASFLTKETAILQPIGSSDKRKQPALAPREHLNMQTPIPLNITSNTPPINRIMAYRDIAKLEKFSGEKDNAYSWIADTEKAITANGWNNDHTPELQELTNHSNEEKITTTADTHSNRTISNSNNLGDPIPATATTARNLDTSSVTAEGKSWTKIKETHTSNPDISKTWYLNIPYLRINCPYMHNKPRAIDYNQGWRNPNNNQVQTNSGLPAQSRPTPTGYPNQASYLSFIEDHGFDKSTPVKGENIEQISQPSKQTKSNISLATITEDTTLAAIFSFNIDNLNTHSLFSGAAINQDKPIMALYTDARVGGIDIKLILDSGSAGSIITKQLIDQLGHQVDRAATVRIITADRNTKTPIGEIDNFPFKINGIQISTKVLVMKATQYQALVENDWLSKANAILN
ncbi:hypothetical protein G9A89_003179 [Geosiphon pyriformis]|nr:hypothetical protein G9A89_003179 [Geosiphon pyriformis]